MKLNLELENEIILRGNDTGRYLYAVTFVDKEDAEDTFIEMWRADDADQLEELVRADKIGDEPDPFVEAQFEEDWGFEILPFKIGVII